MASDKVNLNITGNYTNTNVLLQSVNSVLNDTKKLLESAPVPAPAPAPDTTVPVITLNPTSVTIEASLTAYIDNSSGDTISDNSFSLAELTIDVCSNVVSNAVGTYSVVYTVTDPCGNDASATRIVNVVDTTAPIITLTGEAHVELLVGSSYTELGATATDIVDGVLTSDISVVSDLCTNILGNYNITYSVSDSCGNSSSVLRQVVIYDNVAPTIDLSTNPLTYEATSTPYIDNSAIVTITDNYFPLEQLVIDICSNVVSNVVGTYSVVYTVTDPCNNIAAATRTVNVKDETPPVITLNGNSEILLLQNEVYVELSAVAVDIVDGSVNVDICLGSLDTSVLGTYNIIYSASDSCGNDASAVRTVNVIAPQNIEVYISLESSSIDYEATSTPYVDNSSNVDFSSNYFLKSQLSLDICSNVVSDVVGIYQVVYTVSDPCGNDASAVKVVNVVDNTPPIITLSGEDPKAFEVFDTYVELEASALDIVDGVIPFTSFDVSLNDLCMNVIGSYSIIYTVSDACGNDASAVRTVNVFDTTPPTITLNPITLNYEATSSPYIDNSGSDIISDNYFSLSQLNIEVSNNVISTIPGNYNVIYTVTDPCGNDASSTRVVTVVDNTAPVITLNGDNPQTLTVNTSYIEQQATAVDIVDGAISFSSFQVNLNDLCMNVLGSYSVIYDISDNAGNDASVTRTVNIVDNIPPTIVLDPSTITIEVSNNSYIDNSSSDIISDNYFSLSDLTIDYSNNVISNVVGTYQVICTASDPCGNDTSAVRIVNVITNQPTQLLIVNPSLIDYEIPKYYETQSNGSIVYSQPSTYYKAYCVPTSFANVLNYYSDPSGKDLDLQLNYTSQNSHPPLTDFLYNYQGRPLTTTGVTDLNKIDLGYMFNTNAHGVDLSDGSYTGTKLVDFPKFVDFMNLVSSGAQYRYYNKGFGYNSDVSYTYSSVNGESVSTTSYSAGTIDNVFSDIKSDISNGRPVILSFNHWNIYFNSLYGTSGIINVCGESVYLYDFSGQVASTTDIQSTNPLYSNPEEIEEVWDPEGGLGHTVTCVGYIENIDSKNWVIVQDNVDGTEKYVGVPLDASYLAMVTTIDFSPQGTTPATNLTCLAPDSSVNIVDSGGNKYVFNNGNTFDDTLTYGLYNGTYVINNVPTSHPIAFLNNDVSNVISYSGTTAIVDIVVSGGDFADPYYTFSPNINDSGFNFIPGYTYRFTGNTISNSHPFYISDVGRNQQSTELTFTGDGTFNSGITGTQSFTMTIPYNYTKSSITYYCVAHSSMVKTKSVVSTLVNGNYYNFYDGTLTLIVSGDFGNISAYCLYHGYMGAQNKFTYTTVCNPVANISLSTNISVYNAGDVNNTLPQGYNSCLRLGDNSDICGNYLVNNQELVEQGLNNIGIFVQNEEVYLQANSSIVEFSSVQTLIFKVYDEQLNLMKPLQDVYIILENSDYQLLNQSNPDLNHFVVTANPPLVSANNDPSKYNIGPGLVKIGNLVRL